MKVASDSALIRSTLATEPLYIEGDTSALPNIPFFLVLSDPADDTVYEVVRVVSRAGKAQSGFRVERGAGNTSATRKIRAGWLIFLTTGTIAHTPITPVQDPPGFEHGDAPSDPGETQYLTPTVYHFFEGDVVLPNALWEAVTNVVAEPNGTTTGQVRAVAIPYVTFDGEDASQSPIIREDVGLTDAWVTDYVWLTDNGLTFSGTSYGVSTPYTSDIDPTLVDDWGIDASKFGFLGTAIPGNNDPLRIYTTLPHAFHTDTLAIDATASDVVFDTGEWDFTTLTIPPWTQFIHTEEAGVNAPTPPAHGIFMFEGQYTGHSETTANWASIAETGFYAVLVSRWDRHGTDFAEFLSGETDPRGRNDLTRSTEVGFGGSSGALTPLSVLARSSTLRVTDTITGSWIEGTVETNFAGNQYTQAMNDASDQNALPADRGLIAVTLFFQVTAKDLSGGGSPFVGGHPQEGDQLVVSWRGQL